MDKSIDMTLLGETEGGTNYWTEGPSETELEQISTQPLSAYTVSSLVTAGPDAHHLHRILAAINTACLNNDPKTVVDLCAWILVNEQTYYMEVSMIEIILAYSRAYTLINPDASFFLFYSFLFKMFFKKITLYYAPLKGWLKRLNSKECYPQKNYSDTVRFPLKKNAPCPKKRSETVIIARCSAP